MTVFNFLFLLQLPLLSNNTNDIIQTKLKKNKVRINYGMDE